MTMAREVELGYNVVGSGLEMAGAFGGGRKWVEGAHGHGGLEKSMISRASRALARSF